MGKQNKNLVYITVTTTHSQIPPECDTVKLHYQNTDETMENTFWWQNWLQVRPTETRFKNLKASNDNINTMVYVQKRQREQTQHLLRLMTSTSTFVVLLAGDHLPFSPHVEFDESSSKDCQRANEANGHEDAEQDMVQNHRHKFPLLRSLSGGRGQQARKPCLFHILNMFTHFLGIVNSLDIWWNDSSTEVYFTTNLYVAVVVQ